MRHRMPTVGMNGAPTGLRTFGAIGRLTRRAVDDRRGQGTVRRMTQFPVPLLRTNVNPARSKRVRVPL